MQHTERDEIRLWYKDNDPCEHNDIEKVFYYITETDYWACRDCGTLFMEQDIWKEDNEVHVKALSTCCEMA